MSSPSTKQQPSLGLRMLYGVGSVSYGIKDQGFNVFLLIFYSQVLGLSPALASLALAIAIAVDAVSDPIVGYISDNWRGRLGRRHPFMYAAVLPICASYFFVWNPPAEIIADKTMLFYYLVMMVVVIRIFITFFEIPNSALISEFTDDYDLRTNMMGLRYMFGWWGAVGMGALGYIVFLGGQSSVVADGVAAGYGAYGAAAAGLMFATMMISSLGTHRTIKNLYVPPPRTTTRLIDVFKELWQTTSNPSFRVLFISTLFSGPAAGLGLAMSVYWNTFYWELSPEQIGVFQLLYIPAAICALPISYLLSKRFEKKQAAIGSFAFMILFGPVMLLARQADLLPANGSDLLYLILCIHTFIEVTFIIVFFSLSGAMMADVVEDSAVETDRRSEGVLFAARSFAGKLVSGFGVLLAGIIIGAAQLPSGIAPEDVDPEVLTSLVLFTVPTQVALYGAALFVLRHYRITRKKHGQNLDALSV